MKSVAGPGPHHSYAIIYGVFGQRGVETVPEIAPRIRRALIITALHPA